MYITKEVIDNMYMGFDAEQGNLYEYKSSRSKEQHIPEENREYYITLHYAKWLCRRILKMLKNGAQITPEVLIDSLQRTNWITASYDNKAEFTNSGLCKVLMIKKVPKDNEYKKRFELLDLQASYMAKGSRLVCDLLDDNLEYNRVTFDRYGNVKKEAKKCQD